MLVITSCAALDVTEGTFVDAKTGINFTTYTPPLRGDGNGYFTFGLALPENGGSQNVTEYIGLLVCRFNSGQYVTLMVLPRAAKASAPLTGQGGAASLMLDTWRWIFF